MRLGATDEERVPAAGDFADAAHKSSGRSLTISKAERNARGRYSGEAGRPLLSRFDTHRTDRDCHAPCQPGATMKRR